MGCRFFSFWFLTASCILGKRSGEGCWMFSGEEAQASFYTEKLENDGKAWKYEKGKRCRGVGQLHDEFDSAADLVEPRWRRQEDNAVQLVTRLKSRSSRTGLTRSSRWL